MQENKKQPKPKPGLKRTINLPSTQETIAIEGVIKRLLGTNLDLPDRNDQSDLKPDLKVDLKSDQVDLDRRPDQLDQPLSPAIVAGAANLTIQALPLAAPANESAPARLAGYANQTGLKINPSSDILAGLNLVAGYLQLPNTILDSLCSLLSPDETVIYLQLYRLSYGFNNSFCSVSLPTLSKRTNISERTIYRVLNSLESKSLIKREGHNFGKGKEQGNIFSIAPIPSPAKLAAPASESSSASMADIKDHDHDLLKTNHHQSETMMIYRDLTGNNSWTKSDQAAYEKIKHLSPQEISQLIKSTLEKAHQKPASLAYFVKAYQTPISINPQAKTAIKQKLAAIVSELRELNVGRSYKIADLAEDTKRRCAKEGVIFDNDLFSELVERK